MKALVLQEDLAFGISSVSRFVPPRSQLPVLSNILIETKKGKLKLAATNLEMGISIEVGAKVEREGKTTIPARLISELINNVLPGQVQIEEKDGQVIFSSDNLFSARISTIPANEFPTVPSEAGEKDMFLSRDVLRLLTTQVCFSAAQDETRPVLTGILLVLGEESYAVATDGFRLSYKNLSSLVKGFDLKKEDKGEKNSLLIPSRSIEEMSRILSNLKEAKGIDQVGLVVKRREGQAIFSTDSIVLTGKLIEGDYPNFDRVMPKKWSHKATVGKEDLLRAIKMAAIFAKEAGSVVRLKIERDRLVVAAESQQYGKEESVIDARVEGPDVESAFNYRYILDFLGSIQNEEVSFETEGATSPGVFQDPKDSSYKHLIMPVRIQG